MTHPVQAAAAVTGQPVARVDGRQKVTGAARYAADNPVHDVLYAALVCSAVARGTVERIDTSAALKDRDVVRVFDSFAGVTLPFDSGQGGLLRSTRRGCGRQHTRGGSPWRLAGEGALQHLGSSQRHRLTAGQPRPGQRQTDYTRGDPDGALRSADVVSDRHTRSCVTTTIRWSCRQPSPAGTATGLPCGTRRRASTRTSRLRQCIWHPTDHVRVICPFIGGAFGSAGGTWPHQIMAAFAARQVRRPVKLVLTRKQMYSGIGYRPASRQRLAIGADRAAPSPRSCTRATRSPRAINCSKTASPARRSSSTTARTCARRTASCRSMSTSAVRCAARGDAGHLRARIRHRRPGPPPRS